MDPLKDWTDPDGAMFELGLLLGWYEIKEGETAGEVFRRNKGTFWSNCAEGNALSAGLQALVEAGLLEMDDDSRFRARTVEEVGQ